MRIDQLLKYLVMVVMAMGLSSCVKDSDIPVGKTFSHALIFVTTYSVYSITQTTAEGGGNVDVLGSTKLKECGICWSTSHNPTINNSHISDGSNTGGFFCDMTGLSAGTTYYVRAYAINGAGVIYGQEESFTTKPSEGEYTITISADPSDGGVVYGGGNYDNNQICTLAAIANDGYIFVDWKDYGHSVVSTNANYSFTVNGNRILVAEFMAKPQSYTISVSANPIDGGIVAGSGMYQNGQSRTVYATANSDYIFTNWTENGVQVSSDADYSFVVDDNRTLVANFCCTYNGNEYVDLNLPSGTLWAICNIGANKPEGYGYRFAWGETLLKNVFNWSSYQYCNGTETTLTKYCTLSGYGYDGFYDNITTLKLEDDAASVCWGNDWRIPTKEDWQELYNNTICSWTTTNGVNGRLFTSTNGNSLFLPAAGYDSGNDSYFVGNNGYYFSSSLYGSYPSCSWYFVFGANHFDMGNMGNRCHGLSIRAVRSVL